MQYIYIYIRNGFVSQVEGINGMYLANKLVDNHIKTFITYNKGQTWALLPAPATDVAGNNLNCILVSSTDSTAGAVGNEPDDRHQIYWPHQLCREADLASPHHFSKLNGWEDARLRCFFCLFCLFFFCPCVRGDELQVSRLSINLNDFNLLPVVTPGWWRSH